MKVCVIGLGTIGEPTAEHIHKHGFNVIGYDIIKKNLEDIETFVDWRQVPPCSIYVVTVTSDRVEDVCKLISKRDKKSFVLIESTVPVGTCRNIAKNHGLINVAHCPHRFWSEDPVNHGIKQLRVIGAINQECLEAAHKFYAKLDITLHACSSIEVAELTKISENAYRYVQIAFAEELKMICEEHNIPFEETREACNTKWNIDLLEARDGISGLCLPQDIRFLNRLSRQLSVLDGAIVSNRHYKRRLKNEM